MAGAGAPWQLELEKVEQRCGYLLASGLWSDCAFIVGSESTEEVIQAHRLVLAMATPVFEAMFYGGLSESKDPIVTIPDIQPSVFRALLQYIYTGSMEKGSLDMALELWYSAKKYMLPHLVAQCTSYICSIVGPRNVFRAYEHAHFFEEKTVMDKCIQIISTNTTEVLSDSSFVDVDLNTLITVCSLDHLNVDSELDLFYAVARYANAEQRRQRQISPPVAGGPSSGELLKKVSLPRVESSSGKSPAAELHATPPAEVVTSEPTADKDNLKEERPSIRAALQKLRFLSLTAAQFSEGPARSDLLTKDETFAVFMNIGSRDSPVPMPAGFSECREPRQPRSDSQTKAQCLEPGSLDHTIQALRCGVPSRVKDAARTAAKILGRPPDIQPALDKGILDALIPALTEGDDECKKHASYAIYCLCLYASPAQLRVLAEGAALQPFCSLLADSRGLLCYSVLSGLTDLLKRIERNVKPDLVQRLRALDVPRRLIPLREHSDIQCRKVAQDLLRTYFNNDQ